MPAPKRRGAWSLRDALSPQGDTTPAVKARVVSIRDFDATLLTGGMESERPRVLILCNAASLSKPQEDAVEQFLADGGGVLTTLGSRVDKDDYNHAAFPRGTRLAAGQIGGASRATRVDPRTRRDRRP